MGKILLKLDNGNISSMDLLQGNFAKVLEHDNEVLI